MTCPGRIRDLTGTPGLWRIRVVFVTCQGTCLLLSATARAAARSAGSSLPLLESPPAAEHALNKPAPAVQAHRARSRRKQHRHRRLCTAHVPLIRCTQQCAFTSISPFGCVAKGQERFQRERHTSDVEIGQVGVPVVGVPAVGHPLGRWHLGCPT